MIAMRYNAVDDELKPTDYMVFCAVCGFISWKHQPWVVYDHADWNGLGNFHNIAVRYNLADDTVKDAVRTLLKKGYFTRHRSDNGNMLIYDIDRQYWNAARVGVAMQWNYLLDNRLTTTEYVVLSLLYGVEGYSGGWIVYVNDDGTFDCGGFQRRLDLCHIHIDTTADEFINNLIMKGWLTIKEVVKDNKYVLITKSPEGMCREKEGA